MTAVGFRIYRLDDVEPPARSSLPRRLHNGAGIRETRLPIPSLPVTSEDDYPVAVRLLTHRHATLALPTRSVPVQLNVQDTDAANQGCDIRRTPNPIVPPFCSQSPHHFETCTFRSVQSPLTCIEKKNCVLCAHVGAKLGFNVHHADWRCGLSQSANCDRRV